VRIGYCKFVYAGFSYQAFK